MTEPTWNETIPAARSIARRTDIPLHGTVENPGRRELFEMCGLIAQDGSIPPDDTATYALVDPGGSPGAKDPDAINPRAFVEHGRRPDGMTTPDGLATLQPIALQPKPSKPLPAHGTRARFKVHRKAGEECQPCRDADNTYTREYQAAQREKKGIVPQCGTYSGFMSHRRRGTDACEPCAQASRDYRRDYMQKYRNRKAAS